MLTKLLEPLKHHKYLFYQLTQREIKARYKQSFIGYAWVIFNPLSQMLIYAFVFSIVFKFPTNNIPYVVFLLAALLPWIFTQNSINAATQSLVNNSELLKKVAFPREVIPYSVVLSKIIDFIFSSLIFIFLMFYFQIGLRTSMWLFIPLFLIQLILTTGLSLFLAAFNLFFRDIQYLANLILMIWMYMSPIAYPVAMVPKRFIWLYKLNPLVGIIEGYRSAIFGNPFETTIILWSAMISLIVFWLGFMIFKFSEKYFADVV